MAPKQKPRWERRLKNGYIRRHTNSAGHLVYVAEPLYFWEEYNTSHRYYRYSSWKFANGARHPWRPVDRLRINIPASFGYSRIQAEQSSESAAEADGTQRHRKQKVAVTSSKEGSRSHISLRDDPIEDGCALAEDSSVFLPLGGPWSTKSSTADGSASGATVEDKEVADLVHRGLLDGSEGRGADIRLSDVVRQEPAYTIRYATRKSRKDRRKVSVDIWEDDLVVIEDEDWELV